MTASLFLSETLTIYDAEGSESVRAPSLMNRKGQLKPQAGEILGTVSHPGDVVASLPPSATTCISVRAKAAVGRRITQNDISDALEAALGNLGDETMAVISAEPSRIMLDGKEAEGSPVGKAAQTLEVDVTALLSPLTFLASLERSAEEAGLKLTGVMAMEETAAACVDHEAAGDTPLFVVDRWHGKAILFHGEAVRSSGVSRVGSGHIASDISVTFGGTDDEAEAKARQMLLGRVPTSEEKTSEVALARLDELVSLLTDAARKAGADAGEAILLGLPISPPVEEAFAAHGFRVKGPGLALPKTDPPILALAEGAKMLTSGAVQRSAATALHLSAPKKTGGIIDWLRRNF